MGYLENETMEQKRVNRREASEIYDKYVEYKKSYDDEEIKKETYEKYIRGLMKKAEAFREKYDNKKEYIELINSIVARMNL